MAKLRIPEEKSAIVARCIELEKEGGDILAYLWSENYYTPRATWCNIQREWLGRKPYEYTDGKPKGEKKMTGMNGKEKEARQKRLDELKKRIGEGMGIRAALADMGYTGKSAGQTYRQIRNFALAVDPEYAAVFPEKISDEDTPVRTDAPTPTFEEVKKSIMEIPQIKVDGQLRIETPEANWVTVAEVPEKKAPAPVKIQQPLGYDCFTVRGVEGEFGSYHYQDINGKQWIDYDSVDHANDLSMTVDQWRAFLAELTKAARVLGVEL